MELTAKLLKYSKYVRLREKDIEYYYYVDILSIFTVDHHGSGESVHHLDFIGGARFLINII